MITNEEIKNIEHHFDIRFNTNYTLRRFSNIKIKSIFTEDNNSYIIYNEDKKIFSCLLKINNYYFRFDTKSLSISSLLQAMEKDVNDNLTFALAAHSVGKIILQNLYLTKQKNEV